MTLRRPQSRILTRLLALTKPIQGLILWQMKDLRILNKTLFQSGFYEDAYPDIRKSGFLPTIDYLLFGAQEGRNPHPLFSATYYLEKNPDIRKNRINPLLHYFRRGGLEGRDPHPLFSSQYYLEKRPDVRERKVNPLIHYLRHGAAEGQDPHPLFSGSEYLERYPDVKQGGVNPLLHYVRFGEYEGRRPHSLIDPEFYYATQIDVMRSRRGALTDYLWRGWMEGRSPSPDFDPKYYLMVHSDVASSGHEPLTHYARWGRVERRSIRGPRFESGVADNYVPAASVATEEPASGEGGPVDIIIPAYRGVNEMRDCLESVFKSVNSRAVNVVVINDATPEAELRDYLHELEKARKIHLIEHTTNKGFVSSVNEGMSLHPERDVVLLNSDTQVFANWVDRLARHAHSGRVGSVTPFSNNATICSYPKFAENNPIPEDANPEELDGIMRRVNAGRHCAIPTAVGYCMYVRRDCLRETGLFDEVSFGRGYGEENDFCMAAHALGWTHLLAADVFVYHKGSISFGAAGEIQRRAMEALLKKHPRYLDHVGWHCKANPANAFRITATASRLQSSRLPVWVSVLHGLGGGTLQHVRQIERVTKEDLLWLRLTPAADNHLELSCERAGFEFSVTLHAQQERELLVRLLRQIGVERLHIHHVLEVRVDVKDLAKTLGIPYDITLHDYYFLCPTINLVDEEGRYCGEPAGEECNSCGAACGRNGLYLDTLSWRAWHGAILSGASRVIAPSADAAQRLQRYFPWLTITPAWHETVSGAIAVAQLSAAEPLRVAVLGVMALHKGYNNLQTCSDLARRRGAPVEFSLIGSIEHRLEGRRHAFPWTGPYRTEDLGSLIAQYNPHIIWFPVQIPETFSFTLSACLSRGLPVAAPDLGAFAERLAGREWSWILPWNTSPEDWLNFFVRIREDNFRTGISPPVPAWRQAAESSFYPHPFADPKTKAPTLPRRSEPAKSIFALPSSFVNGQIQACGYIRIVQPLTHPVIGSGLTLHVVDPDSALKFSADALIVQRTAISDEEYAKHLIEHCRKCRIRLIYEIDDDLFHFPEDHPEWPSYASPVKAAKLIARSADAVTVSTEPLRRILLRYNERVVVSPNWVDERLWMQAQSGLADRSSSEIRALYMGTISHKADLALVEEAVRRLKMEYDFNLDVVGIPPDADRPPWFRSISVPDWIAGSYPRFARWLQTAGRWDFGLAPLLETSFNCSKSPIKLYEYAAMGLPAVASDVAVYNQTLHDGETGLLSSNTEDGWYRALKSLCESAMLRGRLRAAVRNAREHWTLAANARQIREAWEAVLFDEPAVRRAAK